MPQAAATTCLYHPTIHFPSSEWVKSQLLYWDCIHRIVPFKGYATHDDPEIVALEEAQLVHSEPATEHREAAADAFLPRLKKLKRSRNGDLTRGGIAAVSGSLDARTAAVHMWKFDQRVVEALSSKDYVTQDGDWFRMGEEVAGLYMTSLAGEAARKLNAPLATSRREFDIASLFFNTPDGAPTAATDSYAFARLTCPLPGPEQTAALGADEFINMHSRSQQARMAFREQMQGMAAELEGLESPRAIEDALRARSVKIGCTMTELAKATNERRVSSAYDLFTLTMPTLVPPALLAVASPFAAALAGGASMSLALLHWFGKNRGSAREERAKCPLHYLRTLESVLSAPDEGTQFQTDMGQLVYD